MLTVERYKASSSSDFVEPILHCIMCGNQIKEKTNIHWLCIGEGEPESEGFEACMFDRYHGHTTTCLSCSKVNDLGDIILKMWNTANSLKAQFDEEYEKIEHLSKRASKSREAAERILDLINSRNQKVVGISSR